MKNIELTKEEQQLAVENIKSYFFTEKEESITDLSAILLLDFILENIGPLIYNQAIKDAHFFMGEKLDDLFSLEKSTVQSKIRQPLNSSHKR
ncbi:hypothetical protein SOV_49500 [Sporomusa ovata DSM 2662]|uniref:DUF2164 domain-containing protein n=1 Tax=Sporomusa ovata TaxID=2378 RepID=A0A0U1L1X1_9FIRM|nr:DUF2164 domain-containing protein [Sporomusa ovata]EQB27323.1 hypothetical protein SOV_2c02190 [Sporomusa ovata DSM 2662]CQR73163.1 hypothetical protein SpAn4DRAFT_2395 [Sporomusa ovata]